MSEYAKTGTIADMAGIKGKGFSMGKKNSGTIVITSYSIHYTKLYELATASTGGTYYPVGVALATLTKVKLTPSQKIGMSAINSAGSAENVKLLRDNEAQFAILQGLYGYYAWNGKGPIEKDGPQKRNIFV